MTALAAPSGGYRTTAASSIDRAIRRSAAAAVLAVTGIAAYVSYWHAYAVVRAHGESGITARLEPATIDGLVSLLSHRGVSIEEIARLVGHASTRTTEIVCRRELRPVITTGAEIMDQLSQEPNPAQVIAL